MTIKELLPTHAIDHHRNPLLTQPFHIIRVQRESYDTFTLELEPTGRDIFVFKPGQFNMLYVYGVGEVPISISGDPGLPGILVHTTRAVGTVTKAMRQLKANDVMGVRGPYGTAWPVEKAEGYDVVIIAGGIGLAPLRPSIYHLLRHREKYGKLVLLYGTRSPDDLLYRKEVEKWRSRFDMEVHVTVDYAAHKWHGNVGFVTNLIAKAPFDPMHTMAMICGPEIMMRFAATELLKRGVEAQNIFLTMERNMKCATGFCGHCQFGPYFTCKDGPVFAYPQVQHWLNQWEV